METPREKAFLGNEDITVTGKVSGMGVDGFIDKALMKAEVLDNLLDGIDLDKYNEVCTALGYDELVKDIK